MSIHDFKTGQVFYGEKLRRHLQDEPISKVERAAEWGRRNAKVLTFWWLTVCLCAGMGWALSGCANADPRHEDPPPPPPEASPF